MAIEQWSEANSQLYQQLSQVVVPARVEQIAALLTLIPFERDAPFHALELASGEGYLAAAILRAFPQATILALDLSEEMRSATASRLAAFGDRGSVAAFDLAAPDWYRRLDGADFVVSSLCIHHLNAGEKQTLFNAVHAHTSDRAAFLIADITEGQHGRANHFFAETLEHTTLQRSRDLTGSDDAYKLFRDEHWNYYHYAKEDHRDQPSPIFHQLLWLQSAGFPVVDCFWMRAGHAIFGGYKAMAPHTDRHLHYNDALQIARDVLGE